MKKYILLLSVLIPCLGLFSCKKFLEERAQTDVIPRTAESLNELLLGEGYQGGSQMVGLQSTFLDDDKEQTSALTGVKVSYYLFTWQPDPEIGLRVSSLSTSPWGAYYKLIQICNVVLDYSEKVTGTAAEKDYITGQAYLLRAFYYFKLVNLYGKPFSDSRSTPDLDLGVPLMLNSGVALEGKKRNTVKEVYQQIAQDLDKGIAALERTKRDGGPYRVNYLAGYFLASRVYLHTGDWQKAIAAATVVLQNKPDLADLNNWGVPNQNTKPVIAITNPETIWAFGSYNDISSGEPDVLNYNLSADLRSLYEAGDLRVGIYLNGKKSTKRGTDYTNIAKTAQAFRVSEALLNRAEAYARLNKAGDAGAGQLAINDLNTLRKKRFATDAYADLVMGTADDLLQKCYAEKRREFFGEEEHRWFDLRRQGMPGISHYYYESAGQRLRYDLQDHDPAYVRQIPVEAIKLNNKLIDNPKPAVRVGK
jgi:tetratricopeptide (TPR) repeat protein